MNYIDLFSGILGFSLGAYWADMKFENHYISEIDPFCCELAKQRFPDAINLGDIRNHKEWKLEPGEYIITGGYPCQPFSCAGKQLQEKDDRNLWPFMQRIIRRIRPLWVVAENVAGSTGYIKNVVLPDLDAADYEAWPIGISAAAMGAPHIRKRIWILAHANKEGQPQSKGPIGEIRRRLIHGGQNMADDAGARLRDGKERRSIAQLPGLRTINKADWEDVEYIDCTDGYLRPVKPGIYLLVDGIPGTVEQLEGFGNAIVPQIAELLWRQIKDICH